MTDKLIIKISQMSVKGGDLPDGFQAHIDVDLNFTGVPILTLAQCCSGGSSARVQLQGQLRKKSTKDLNKLALTGLVIHYNDIATAGAESAVDIMMGYTREKFIKTVADFDIKEPEAHEIYNRKHGLDPNSRE